MSMLRLAPGVLETQNQVLLELPVPFLATNLAGRLVPAVKTRHNVYACVFRTCELQNAFLTRQNRFGLQPIVDVQS